ncbi:PREDICTED: uncharacterized protein At5g08430 isoform X2 [Prunus mume]|uniref:Uncharacterized protein At5g08430 isoform X2 n=1 Tax=Prunus mume TaxID=102107 RepID=A0ABM0NP59_PRUMU|nr:PREDICTED: uncharacterized protein At5g08430 isoform X2 [Prunus mume]
MDCSFSWTVDPTPNSDTTPNPDPNSTPFRQIKRVRSKKLVEFTGWGSRRLFEFLESIGRDTSNPISQYDVASIITDYVNQHKLQHPTKKKRIVCDDTLHSLFGRKTIGRVKIYDLLHQHFAENQQDDSTDNDENDDDDENPFSNYFLGSADDNISQSQSRQRKQKKPKRIDSACPPKSKSCFAAVIPENIKLVYLRRSLVEHLLLHHSQQEQQPQNQALFEEAKVVGSLVRIKADPNDISQKNSHQLLQVTGLVHDDNVSSSSSNRGVLLRLSGLAVPKQVQISELSDDNFSPEECEDLLQRIKDGLLKSLTVVELQEKVQMLHEDITKHWLVRELALLQKLIDQANEKGWRRELFEYLERRQLLQTPDEQARLLREVPEVIADEIELEVAPKDAPDEVQEGNHSSPTDIQRGASEGPICDMPAPTCDVPAEEALLTRTSGGVDSEASKHDASWQEWREQPTESSVNRSNGGKKRGIIDTKGFQKLVDKLVITSQVIDLSNDEENEERYDVKEIPGDQLGSLIWHYLDPQGNIQGPFSIDSLKSWSDAEYFPPDFKIWKAGQSLNQAVLLKRILQQTYPNKVSKD